MSEEVTRAEIMRAIEDVKSDNARIWHAITELNQAVSAGKGAVQALVWIGGIVLAVGSTLAAWINAFKHP